MWIERAEFKQKNRLHFDLMFFFLSSFFTNISIWFCFFFVRLFFECLSFNSKISLSCTYPFRMSAVLQMVTSDATVHLNVENYFLVHLHGQAPEKRIAMKMFGPANRLCSVRHLADEFRCFASLNVINHP